MKILILVSRVIVGMVFMFSGVVKAIDPLGSAYKFSDYFQAFNLTFLKPISLFLAVILFTAEFISGFSVFTGYRQKAGIWGVGLLMLIFTPLTLILALTNPVSDCGCFGDAVHLTNWQTFGKNIILAIMVLILFSGENNAKHILTPNKEWLVILTVSILFVIFSLLNIRYLQLFDFLPYKSGTSISEGMKIPEGKPADQYQTTFIYEKNGLQKEFTLENYPADDSAWKFVDQKSVLIKKGYQPPIHDFSITAKDGTSLTDMILSYPGYTLLLISTKLEQADKKHLEKGFELGMHCLDKGIDFVVLTSSGSDEINKYSQNLTICTADEAALKTIVRSNPGYLLLRNGVIAGKWSWATIPSKTEFTEDLNKQKVDSMNKKRNILIVYSSALSAIMLFLLISSIFSKQKGIS